MSNAMKKTVSYFIQYILVAKKAIVSLEKKENFFVSIRLFIFVSFAFSFTFFKILQNETTKIRFCE